MATAESPLENEDRMSPDAYRSCELGRTNFTDGQGAGGMLQTSLYAFALLLFALTIIGCAAPTRL